MAIHNGGAAFPSGEKYYSVDLAGNRNDHSKGPLNPGMTLRDYFAAKAMQSIVLSAAPQIGSVEQINKAMALASYAIADAMIAERGE